MSLSCTEKEIQSVAHWFNSWSFMQKIDFYRDLIEKAAPPQVDNLFDAMKTLNVQDKPPSIFQCQLKLFTQWFDGWSQNERQIFIIKLAEIDPHFVSKFNQEVSALQSICWTEREVEWTVHWFKGWNGQQRQEFLNQLVEKSRPATMQSLDFAMNSLTMSDGPDLFHCQLHLFGQWYNAWTDKDKNMMVEKIRALDAHFVDRLSCALSTI